MKLKLYYLLLHLHLNKRYMRTAPVHRGKSTGAVAQVELSPTNSTLGRGYPTNIQSLMRKFTQSFSKQNNTIQCYCVRHIIILTSVNITWGLIEHFSLFFCSELCLPLQKLLLFYISLCLHSITCLLLSVTLSGIKWSQISNCLRCTDIIITGELKQFLRAAAIVMAAQNDLQFM